VKNPDDSLQEVTLNSLFIKLVFQPSLEVGSNLLVSSNYSVYIVPALPKRSRDFRLVQRCMYLPHLTRKHEKKLLAVGGVELRLLHAQWSI
jgi:hypothetical protein